MSSLHQYPAISAHNEETEPDHISRLHEAFGVMCAIARMVWREETRYGSTEPGLIHTRWDGAIIALRETSGQLEVIWASADHRERFGVLAELGWEAMSEARTNVVHRLPTGDVILTANTALYSSKNSPRAKSTTWAVQKLASSGALTAILS